MGNGCKVVGVKLSDGTSMTIDEYKKMRDTTEESIDSKEVNEVPRSQYQIMFSKVDADLIFVSKIVNKVQNTKLNIQLNKTLLGDIPTSNILISCRDYEMLLIPVGETGMATTRIRFKGTREIYVKDTLIDTIFSFIELFSKYKVKGKIRTKYAGRLQEELKQWVSRASKSTNEDWDRYTEKENTK